MKRILQTTSSLRPYGTETFIMNVFRNIDRSRFMFDFLVNSEERDGFYDEIINLGGRVFHVPTRKEGLLSCRKAYDSFFSLHADEFSAIHFEGISFSSVIPFEFARKYGIEKRIAHIHGSNCTEFHNRIFHRINKHRISNLATHWLACSPEAQKWGFGNTNAFPDSRVIANGIDFDNFRFNKTSRQKKRAELGLSDQLAIAHIGSFLPVKNHSFLIDIFSRIKEIKKDSLLFLVGDGPLQNSVKTKIRDANLEDSVSFLGVRNDVAELLSAFDVMILPSHHEGVPMAILESIASSLPVISSDAVSGMLQECRQFHKYPLQAGADVFAIEALKLSDMDRTSLSPMNAIGDFDIHKTVSELEKIYSE